MSRQTGNFRKYRHQMLTAVCLSGFLLAVLLWNIDLNGFMVTLQQASPGYFGFVVAGYLMVFLFRTFRYWLIFKKRPITIFLITAVHNGANRILPLRIGELVLPYLFKKHLSVDYVSGFGSMLLVRFIDILCVILLFTGSALFCDAQIQGGISYALLMAVLAVQAVILFKLKTFTAFAARQCGAFHQRSKFLANAVIKIGQRLNKISASLGHPSAGRRIMLICLFTVCVWLSNYAIYYAYIKMFALDFTYLQVTCACSIVTLTSNLPVSSLGRIGAFELGWMIGFMLFGMSKDTAVLIGLFTNVTNLMISALLALMCYMSLPRDLQHQTTSRDMGLFS